MFSFINKNTTLLICCYLLVYNEVPRASTISNKLIDVVLSKKVIISNMYPKINLEMYQHFSKI